MTFFMKYVAMAKNLNLHCISDHFKNSSISSNRVYIQHDMDSDTYKLYKSKTTLSSRRNGKISNTRIISDQVFIQINPGDKFIKNQNSTQLPI